MIEAQEILKRVTSLSVQLRSLCQKRSVISYREISDTCDGMFPVDIICRASFLLSYPVFLGQSAFIPAPRKIKLSCWFSTVCVFWCPCLMSWVNRFTNKLLIIFKGWMRHQFFFCVCVYTEASLNFT